MSQLGPQELFNLFQAVKPRGAEERTMGGSPAAVVNGNMFMRVRRSQFVLRLSEAHRTELLRQPGTAVFEAIPGRPMKEYIVLPPSVLRDSRVLQHWVQRSYEYAAGLTPQAKSGLPKAQPRTQSVKTTQIKRIDG